jgi:signal transduction histidine kinase
MSTKIDKVSELEKSPGQFVGLVVADDFSVRGAIKDALKESNQNCEIIEASSIEEFRERLKEKTVDFVAFDLSKIRPEGVFPIYETKLCEHSIGTIVLADDLIPTEFDTMMRAGCDRILVKKDDWLKELRGAIRQVVRFRKLENENNRLLGVLGEANKELLSRNSRLNEYTSTVAHDIRGLISNLVMRIEFALELGEGQIPADIRAQIESAASTGRRIVEVVQSSYELARLGENHQKFEKVDLKTILEEVRIDLGIDNDHSIKLNIEDLPAAVCNRGLIRRVFLNLISNSIRYRKGESLKISIKADASTESGYIRIKVKDNGQGISAENQRSIFRPFWRGTSKGEGLGLGLAIVDKIVAIHGGTISVNSKPGRGAEFIISLPKTLSSQ